MIHPIWGHVAGAITVVLMGVFVGIWVWAWNKRHLRTFHRLASIPMQDAADDNHQEDHA